MKKKVYIGIDPGLSGGIAISIEDDTKRTIETVPFTRYKTPGAILDWFDSIWEDNITYDVHAVIEKVQGYIGGKGEPGSSMFKFGCSYGQLLMLLTCERIPYTEVAPRKWQAEIDISPRKKDESKTQWKNRLKIRAMQLYPTKEVTLATADALLLLYYCRLKGGS